jgi:hypothetical protein
MDESYGIFRIVGSKIRHRIIDLENLQMKKLRKYSQENIDKEDESESATCANCYNEFDLGELESGEDFGYEDLFCQHCFNDKFPKCPECENRFDITDEEYAVCGNASWDKSHICGCSDCYSTCDLCKKVEISEELVSVHGDGRHDGGEACGECVKKFASRCAKCDAYSLNEFGYKLRNKFYDRECFYSVGFGCGKCGFKYLFKDNKPQENEYGDLICQNCQLMHNGSEDVPEYFDGMGIKPVESVSFSPSTRGLERLEKYLPMSAKEFKSKFPQLANRYKDLIPKSEKTLITSELLENFEKKFNKGDYGLSYSAWAGLQRSISSAYASIPQLVIHINISGDIISNLEQDYFYSELFDKINKLSKDNNHPHCADQMGWARLELDPNKEFILVDEVQSDHDSFYRELSKNALPDYWIKNPLKERFNLSDEQFMEKIKKYPQIINQKDFPNIADKAIVQFARQNGFQKIYWHEYESGKRIKDNNPPRSLYTDIPRENGYVLTDEKPFGLDGKFFVKEARMNISKLVKLARSLYMKHVYLA